METSGKANAFVLTNIFDMFPARSRYRGPAWEFGPGPVPSSATISTISIELNDKAVLNVIATVLFVGL